MIPVFAAPSPQFARTLRFVREVPKQSNRIFPVDSPVTAGFSTGKIMILKHSHLDVAIIDGPAFQNMIFPAINFYSFIYNDISTYSAHIPSQQLTSFFQQIQGLPLFTSFFSSLRNVTASGLLIFGQLGHRLKLRVDAKGHLEWTRKLSLPGNDYGMTVDSHLRVIYFDGLNGYIVLCYI